MSKRTLGVGLVLVMFAGMMWLLFKGLHLNPNQHSSPWIGKRAPDFEVTYVLGGTPEFQKKIEQTGHLSLKDCQGSVVLLNFWASWCTSCAEEAMELEQLWRRFRKNGLVVIGVASHDTLEDVKSFATKIGKTYLIGLDTKDKAALDYGVSGVPETFLIDRNGIVRDKESGPIEGKVWFQKIQNLLPET